LHLTVNVRYTV